MYAPLFRLPHLYCGTVSLTFWHPARSSRTLMSVSIRQTSKHVNLPFDWHDLLRIAHKRPDNRPVSFRRWFIEQATCRPFLHPIRRSRTSIAVYLALEPTAALLKCAKVRAVSALLPRRNAEQLVHGSDFADNHTHTTLFGKFKNNSIKRMIQQHAKSILLTSLPMSVMMPRINTAMNWRR